VDSDDVSRWFGEYLSAFAACGRGDSETASLLAHYGVPLLLTTEDGFFALTSGDQIVAAVQGQIDGMRAAGFDRTQVLSLDVSLLNSRSALVDGTFSYRRRGGDEMRQVSVTYVVTDGAGGRRISVLAVRPTAPAARP
jgi:hypothetical protein